MILNRCAGRIYRSLFHNTLVWVMSFSTAVGISSGKASLCQTTSRNSLFTPFDENLPLLRRSSPTACSSLILPSESSCILTTYWSLPGGKLGWCLASHETKSFFFVVTNTVLKSPGSTRTSPKLSVTLLRPPSEEIDRALESMELIVPHSENEAVRKSYQAPHAMQTPGSPA